MSTPPENPKLGPESVSQPAGPTHPAARPPAKRSVATIIVRLGLLACIGWLVWEHGIAPKLFADTSRKFSTDLETGQYADARADAVRLTHIIPSDPTGWYSKAQADDRLGSYADEVVDLNRTEVFLEPPYSDSGWGIDISDVAYARALAEDHLRDYKSAIIDYSEAARIDPSRSTFRLHCAADDVRTGQYASALAEYDTVLKVNPHNPAIQAVRAKTAKLAQAAHNH